MIHTLKLFLAAVRHWYARDANIYAAALAYFMPFALVPMLALAIAIISLVVSEAVLVETLVRWGNSVAPRITPIVADAVESFTWSNQFWGIPLIGLLVIGWVLLSTLSLLVRGLHHIWRIPDEGAWRQVELLFRSGLFFLTFIFFLTLVVTVSIFAPDLFGTGTIAIYVQNAVVFMLTVGFFTLGFGILTRHPMRWRARLVGSITIAVLLLILRVGLGWWLAFTPAIDLFGAGGVMLGLLIIIYAMTAIIYFGAAVAYQFERPQVRDKMRNV